MTASPRAGREGAMDAIVLALGIVIALAGGIVLGYVARGVWTGQAVKHAQEKAGRILAEAREQQKDLILKAKDEQFRLQRQGEEEARAKRAELSTLETRLLPRAPPAPPPPPPARPPPAPPATRPPPPAARSSPGRSRSRSRPWSGSAR